MGSESEIVNQILCQVINLNVGVVFGCSGVPNAVASLALLEGLFCSVSAVGF
jgi:hypothetical protein